tara:strand:+ start:2399 stop:3496 length:1098 start_codon:yes stop_codon:yes gene_type:complete
MKLKEIIYYYPSFEKGGVEKILLNLIKYSKNLKIRMTIITSKKIMKTNSNLSILIVKKKSNRILTALFSIYQLLNILKSKYKSRNNICILSLQNNSIAIIFGKLFGYKVAIRNSEYPFGSLLNTDENTLKSIFILFQKIIFYNFANLIISNSLGSSKTIKKFIINKKKVIHIYNPYLIKIDKENFTYKKNIILYVGRFVKQKGIIYLLEAFKQLNKKFNNFELWLVGSGPDKKLIDTFIKTNKLNKKIKLFGWKKKINKFYKKAKYFVLPSVYEGLGNVIIDALNFSRTCIVSDCKHGPKEVVMNGRGGFIFKSKNYFDLYNKLIKLENKLSVSKNKIRYGRKGLKRFLIKNQSKKYIDKLNSIL